MTRAADDHVCWGLAGSEDARAGAEGQSLEEKTRKPCAPHCGSQEQAQPHLLDDTGKA